MGIKDNKCVLITLFLLALATEGRSNRRKEYRNQISRPQRCKIQLFYLPEDAAKANAFRKDLAIQSRGRRLGRVSTRWLSMEVETAEVTLMKKLQEKMEQQEKWMQPKLNSTEKAILEVKKTTEKNEAALLKVSTSVSTAATEDLKTAKGVLTAVDLMKQLPDKMKQLEKRLQPKLDSTEKAILEVKKATEKNEAALQKDLATLRKLLTDSTNHLEQHLNSKIGRTFDFIREVEKTTGDNDLKLQNTVDSMNTDLTFLAASQRCILAGPGTTFTVWGCFKGFLIKSTFIASQDKCNKEGLKLASFANGPDTKRELASLVAKIKLEGMYWIDLTYNTFKEWRWKKNGVQVETQLWGKEGPPTNGAIHSAALVDSEGGLLKNADKKLGLHFVLCALPPPQSQFPLGFRDMSKAS